METKSNVNKGIKMEITTPIVFVCGQCYRGPGVTEVSSVSSAGFSVTADCCLDCARKLTGMVSR